MGPKFFFWVELFNLLFFNLLEELLGLHYVISDSMMGRALNQPVEYPTSPVVFFQSSVLFHLLEGYSGR